MEILKLAPAAQERASALLAKETEPKAGLRVAVSGGGCSGLQYRLEFDSPSENDTLHTCENGLLVMVDEKSALYLLGSVVEYHDGLTKEGFEVVNPNANSTCGCGSSFN